MSPIAIARFAGSNYVSNCGETLAIEASRARHVARLLDECAWLIDHDGMPLNLAMYMTGLLKESPL